MRSVDCIVADDNPLLDFKSIKNLNLYKVYTECFPNNRNLTSLLWSRALFSSGETKLLSGTKMCIFRQTKGQTGKEMEPGQHFMVPGVVHKFQMICFRGVKSSSGNRIRDVRTDMSKLTSRRLEVAA